jgi:hypothetical protein
MEERMRNQRPDSIGIEIHQRAGPLFCNDDIRVEHGISVDEHLRPPRPGCDISQQNKSSTGTMGGYAITEATDTKKRTTFGFTNAYVALASKFQPLHTTWPLKFANIKTIGYEETSFNVPASESIGIQSPCEKTRTRDKTKLLDRVTQTEERIQRQNDIIEAVKETDPSQSHQLGKSLKTGQSRLASLKNDLQLPETDPYIGSGHKVKLGHRDYTTTSLQTNKLMIDLALIRMDCLADKKPQEIYWKENGGNPPIWKNTTCNFWEVDLLGDSQDAEKHIKVVAKLLRSGFYTIGIVNDFKAKTFPFYKNGQPASREVDAWVITCPRKHERAGDSPYYQYRDVYLLPGPAILARLSLLQQVGSMMAMITKSRCDLRRISRMISIPTSHSLSVCFLVYLTIATSGISFHSMQ